MSPLPPPLSGKDSVEFVVTVLSTFSNIVQRSQQGLEIHLGIGFHFKFSFFVS